jgi:hypothetical protein
MTRKPSLLRDLFNVLGAASSAAAATREHRAPATRDLRTLGIAPEQFRTIGR